MFCLQSHARCPWKPEEGVGSSVTGVMDGCEVPCECWDSNPSPLEGQPSALKC